MKKENKPKIVLFMIISFLLGMIVITGTYAYFGVTSGYSWPNSKYYDTYAYHTSESEYTRGLLGDATIEVGPFKRVVYANNVEQFISSWYSNRAHFVTSSYPWFTRGGQYSIGIESGMFAFALYSGSVQPYFGFRVVITS